MTLDEVLTALQQRTIGPDEAERLLQSLQEKVHPLLAATFTGDEFFLADHVVKGSRVLPGVAYLEMARAALVRARGLDDRAPLRLANVAWARPLVADAPVSVRIDFDGDAFAISSGDTVHCTGTAAVHDVPAIAPVRVAPLRALCTSVLKAEPCYAAFRAIGLAYGPAHRALDQVAAGADESGRRFVLADVALPEHLFETYGEYTLHPSIMDAALQAPIGLVLGSAGMSPALPFALGELQVVAPCPPRAVVVVTEAAGTSENVRKLNIDVCDAAGNVCVRFLDFTARVLDGAADRARTMLLRNTFEPAPLAAAEPVAYAAQHTFRCEPGGPIAARFEHYAASLLQLLKSILQEKPKRDVLVQVVVPADGEGWLFSGLSGMLKTARQENPRLIGQLIGIEDEAALPQILRDNAARPDDAVIRYQGGVRRVARFEEIVR